ncbi:MAG TPA: LytR C-terminal domain-containing protein [Gemmatimonadaceae bacterium]|nr:LytR C-terminal domain-containing protein [Gemmatimonadaceae bacterium]
MERGALRRRRLAIAAGALLVIVLAAGVYVYASRAADEARPTAPYGPDARAPQGVRIRVEVLNATKTRGLARRATMHLRDRGFDVVFTGTSREQRDTTLVVDRTAHPDWARLVGLAMGGAPVEARPDSSRHVDVTVLIGSTWRPPAEPFYP